MTACLAVVNSTSLRRMLMAAVMSIMLPWFTLAQAGQTCESKPPSAQVVQNAMNLATKVHRSMAAEQVDIALIARAGQDLSKYGLKYSHVGLLVRVDSAQSATAGAPTVVYHVKHLLNSCGTDQSDLFDEGLANFFLDDLYRFEAAIFIPSKEVQAKLRAALSQGRSLHESRYNMLAHPFNTKYQNSNQWLLELVAKALNPRAVNGAGVVQQRADAQQWLQANAYAPTTLQLGTMVRLGARMTRANVAFDDHPNDRRFAGQIDVVTVDSIFAFMKKMDPQARLWGY